MKANLNKDRGKDRTGGRVGQEHGDEPGVCARLADLRPGERARICAHAPVGDVPPRLEELGFVPGTAIEVLRRAPLGDPVEVEIRGYRICLRRTELATLCAVLERGRP